MGLDLLVKSEYNLDGSFDRNTFFVEGKSGLKYRYGISGALPLGFSDTALYPQATLDKLPSIIKQQRERIAKQESELPTLQAIVSRTWGRQDELTTLKQECDELKKRIEESLKGNRPELEEAETDTPPIPGRRATDYAAWLQYNFWPFPLFGCDNRAEGFFCIEKIVLGVSRTTLRHTYYTYQIPSYPLSTGPFLHSGNHLILLAFCM